MKIAIVTGASSGLGWEFVRRIDGKYHPDEIWAVARRGDRLNELKALCPAVRPFPLDLAKEETLQVLRDTLEREDPEVTMLVNAAGFAKMGTYTTLTFEEINGMIDVNCKAAVALTVLAIPHMKKHARILEVCSAAAFQPLPGLNVYAATKAFMLSFSRALRWELFGRRIKVTAVCPDWVKTEFIGVAKDTAGNRAVRHFPLAASAKGVVSLALFDSRIGAPVSTYSVSILHRLCAKFIPHEIVIAAWELIRRI